MKKNFYLYKIEHPQIPGFFLNICVQNHPNTAYCHFDVRCFVILKVSLECSQKLSASYSGIF